jgi:N-acetylglucosamine kinase-like BadF-type ATPase
MMTYGRSEGNTPETERMSVFIGVDGGGTKTCCIAIDASRNVLGRFVSGASNQNSVGEQVAADNVLAGIRGALAVAQKTPSDST